MHKKLAEGELNEAIAKSQRGWLTRSPSVAFDSLDIWDDVITGRLMYKKLLEVIYEKRGGI